MFKQPKNGYWETDDKGKPLRFLHEDTPAIKLDVTPRGSVLYRKKKVFKQVGNTPFPVRRVVSQKENCLSVNLTANMGKVHTQIGGTCYAFAATELLNFEEKENYSALYLAKMVEQPNTIPGFDGATLNQVLEHALDRGVCPEKFIPSFDTYDDIINNYGLVANEDKKISCVADRQFAFFKNEFTFAEMMSPIIRLARLVAPVKRAFPYLGVDDMEAIYFRSIDVNDFLKNVFHEACKNKMSKIKSGKKIVSFYVSEYKNEDDDVYIYEDDRIDLINMIHVGMSKNRPVAISYLSEGLILPVGTQNDSFHSSVIAGRAWVDEELDKHGNVKREGSCYYIVKNSWGENWSPPKGSKALGVTHLPGYYMMSEKMLMEHTLEAVFLD